MIPNIGATELIIALIIILLLFGAKRIPQLARELGRGMREFREGASGGYEEENEQLSEAVESEQHEDVDAFPDTKRSSKETLKG